MKNRKYLTPKEEVELLEGRLAPRHQRSAFWDRVQVRNLIPVDRTTCRVSGDRIPERKPDE